MNPDFEPILAALLAHLKANIANVPTFGRRLKSPNEVSDQPAIFVRHTGEADDWQGPLPRTIVKAEIWIFCKAGKDPHVAPDSGLNAVALKVRTALAPALPMLEPVTLNGQVAYCRIEGESEFDPGDLTSQGIAVLPVCMLLP